jgi:integrase
VTTEHIDRHANTVGALAVAYFGSTEFVRNDPKTQRERRHLIENCLRVQPKGWEHALGDLHHSNVKDPLKKWHAEAVLANLPPPKSNKAQPDTYRDRHLDAISGMLNWGRDQEICLFNPFANIDKLAGDTDGHHTWTDAQVAQYTTKWKHANHDRRPWLVFMFLLHTAVRISDVAQFTLDHLDRTTETWVLRFTEWKQRNVNPKQRAIPVTPELRACLETTSGALDGGALVKAQGGDNFKPKGLSEKFADWCHGWTVKYRNTVTRHEGAGLPVECTAHGIRKYLATAMAEAGVHDRVAMETFGWTTTKQYLVYSKRVDKHRMTIKGVEAIRALTQIVAVTVQ